MDVLNTFTRFLFAGFTEVAIALFVLRIIVKKFRLLWADLFLWSNSILLAVSILYGVTILTQLLTAWYAQVPEEQAAFRWRITGPYWYSYWMMILAPACVPQLFWIRNIRKSAIASLIMIPFLSIGAFMELIIVYCAPFHDSRPATWMYYPPKVSELLIPFFSFGTLLLAVYFVSRQWRTRKSFRSVR